MKAASIEQLIGLCHGGAFSVECTDLLRDVVKSVAEQQKSTGKLTITFDFKANGGVINVVAKVTDKQPQVHEVDTFWPTVEGNLSLQNPAQRSLELRDATVPERKIVDVG